MMSFGQRSKRGSVLAIATVLGACSSTPNLNPGGLLSGGRDLEAEQRSLAEFAPIEVCPEIQVRDGTQTMTISERARGSEPGAVRFQATLTKFARECKTTAGVTTVRVGVAGRLLAGLTGATGTVDLPVRVALVRNGSELVSSELLKIPATINPGEAQVLWSRIVDNLSIPSSQAQARYVIYVGFDEGEGQRG